MAWNGTTPNAPNWAGTDNAGGDGGVGDLYILPDPPSIAENPSIGLEGRNEVPLPTAYKDFNVDDLNAVTINGSSTFDASNWWRFPANGNVTATLGLFSLPQYDISGFRNITCSDAIQSTGGSVTAALNVDAGVRCAAPLGSFPLVVSSDIEVSQVNKTGDVNIYGVNKLAGDNALFVEGGTTLTGGGIIHGVVIGALRDPLGSGFDLVRIDVLPVGMTLTSATFIATTAAGAASLVAGGALALAGGDYISYNSDKHTFINTTFGNDNTEMYIGQIHAAEGGSLPLRINDGARGVELSTINSMTMTTQLAGVLAWSNATSYVVNNKVSITNTIIRTYYNCVRVNKNLDPTAPVPNWISAANYVVGNVVFSSGLVYRCLVNVSGSTTPPASDPTNWTNLGLTTNSILNFWVVFSPSVANITGDDVSNITIGTITAPVDFVRMGGSGLVATGLTSGLVGFNYVDLVAQTGSDATIYFNDSFGNMSSKIFMTESAKRLIIQNDNGLTINNTGATTTDFSDGVVENVKTLTLTSTIFSAWSASSSYPDNAEVEYDNANWVGQFAGNRGNIPDATLQDWVSGDGYDVGNVRYYSTDNTAYLCILAVTIGTTTPPPSDLTHWSEFQVGNNGEDVWFPFTAPVVSTIAGDRVSLLEIGNITCVGDVGSYLEITADPNDNANGLVQSAGVLGLVGNTGVQMIATAGNITTASLTGAVSIQSIEQNIEIKAEDTTNGVVAITGKVGVGLESENAITLQSGGNVDINADTTLGLTSTGDCGIASQSGDVEIVSNAANIIMTSTLATTITADDTMGLTSFGDMTLTSTNGDVVISANTGADITTLNGSFNIDAVNGGMTIAGNTGITINSGDGSISLNTPAGGVDITTSSPVNIVSGTDVNITTGTADGNITINTYYPPLTIYKNATIGSAISRAANTAEVQVYPQTYTLKATTQYMLNMSYSGLTENAGTGTPNNNWYIIYRVHPGTTLTTTNLIAAPAIFNNTQIGAGISTCFMTTAAGTYTGRFYIRNQNLTIALNVANISATITEVF